MKAIPRVIRNSFWLGIPSVVLNIISIFIIGYIARTLGHEGYGKFILAFSFIALFTPLCNLGLRAITVRNIATNRKQADSLLGKIFILRIVLSCITFLLLLIIVNLLNYPLSTRIVIYIAGGTLFFNTAATTFFDAFQAFEKMESIAYAKFISGIILTALSVAVLFMGYRLVGLTLVYLLGSILLSLFAFLFYRGSFPVLKFQIDLSFWRECLYKGMPFFLVGFLSIVELKIGIILLSKMAGESHVGMYGAASSLIERLILIPDSICTAVFPTMAFLYLKSKIEAGDLFDRFFNYMLLLGLPIAIGTSLLSRDIIGLIYGMDYINAAGVLAILAWTLPLIFIGYLQSYSLGAINLQAKVVKVSVVSTLANIVLCIVLIPTLHEKGVATANLVSSLLFTGFTFYYVAKHLFIRLRFDFILKAIGANILMALAVMMLKDYNLLLAVAGPAFVYLIALRALKVITGEDWTLLKASFARGKSSSVAVAEE